jgi:hypothetical protein
MQLPHPRSPQLPKSPPLPAQFSWRASESPHLPSRVCACEAPATWNLSAHAAAPSICPALPQNATATHEPGWS